MKLIPLSLQGKAATSVCKLTSVMAWVVLAGVGSQWLGSMAKTAGDSATLPGIPATPRVQCLRANLMKFNRTIPRPDLVAYATPVGNSKPNDLRIELSPTWNALSRPEQKSTLCTWTTLWFETVKTNPADSSKPHIRFQRSNGAPVKNLS